MPRSLSDVLLLTGKSSRREYLLTGLVLAVVKYVIDWLTATQIFGREWSPLRYLIWPDRETVQIHRLAPDDQPFALALLLIALPFIYIGVTMTLRRLRDSGLTLSFVLLFFVPAVNLTLIAMLCVAPSNWIPDSKPRDPDAESAHRRVWSDASSFWLASLGTAILAIALVFLSANVLQSYGFGIFVGAPFGIGWLATTLFCLPKRRTLGSCFTVSMSSLGFAALILVLIAIEGVVCLLMAAPICIPITLLGSLVGWSIQFRSFDETSKYAMMLAVCVAMPLTIAGEAYSGPLPTIREVVTDIVIDAPPDVVWKYVIAFPPLDEPRDLLFRSGIAYPQRAEIRGNGVGAIRHCVFSTGSFVEPITTWDEPRLLAFDVTDQPAPMEELSPFHIHPPHLDHFLLSHRGQFRLEQLPDGRTRLEGTTWYSNRMWPAEYWNLCSDAIIGRIHSRVLDHIRNHAESETHLLKR